MKLAWLKKKTLVGMVHRALFCYEEKYYKNILTNPSSVLGHTLCLRHPPVRTLSVAYFNGCVAWN
jgi:hypothetical protein